MKIKTISVGQSLSQSDNFKIQKMINEFDLQVEQFSKNENIIDCKVIINQKGTSNWLGGIHSIIMTAIITYQEKETINGVPIKKG